MTIGLLVPDKKPSLFLAFQAKVKAARNSFGPLSDSDFFNLTAGSDQNTDSYSGSDPYSDIPARLFSLSVLDDSLSEVVRNRIIAVHGNGVASKTLRH